MTTGHEGFPAALPFTLDPAMTPDPSDRTSTPLTKIDFLDGPIADGLPVELSPRRKKSEPGNYTATLELDWGPADVNLFRMEGCA